MGGAGLAVVDTLDNDDLTDSCVTVEVTEVITMEDTQQSSYKNIIMDNHTIMTISSKSDPVKCVACFSVISYHLKISVFNIFCTFMNPQY